MNLTVTKFNKLLNTLLKDKNLEENLSKIIREIEADFEFQSVGIFLKLSKSNLYRLKIARNISHCYEKNTIFSSDDQLIRDLSNLKPLKIKISNIINLEKEFSHLVILPVHNNLELLGFIFIDRMEGEYTNSEITVLEIYASIISMIVSFVNQRMLIERMTDVNKITGMYSYKTFYEKTEKMLFHAKRYNRDISIITLKLDNFENIIGTIGKKNTDSLLKQISCILTEHLRETDLIGHIYQDTFVITMPETHENISLIAIYRVDEKIKKLSLFNNFKVGWGVIEKKNKEDNLEELLRKSKEAAFESTRKEDDNVTIY